MYGNTGATTALTNLSERAEMTDPKNPQQPRPPLPCENLFRKDFENFPRPDAPKRVFVTALPLRMTSI